MTGRRQEEESGKNVEEALRKKERQLAASQRVARLGSWEWDIVNNKITWSDELYRIFGLKPQEFEATYEAFLNVVHPDDREKLDSAVKKSLSDKKPYHVDARIIRPDGSEWVMEARGEVTYDKSGNPLLMGGTAQDVTERKQIEEDLLRHRKELSLLIEDKTSELKAVIELLQDEIARRRTVEAEAVRAGHLAALGELAAGVAHEINNPINGIINYTQILANRSKKGSEEHDIANRIIKESNRIAGIVSNLLSFARDRKDEKIPTGIQDVLSDSLALIETQIRKEGIRLKVDIPSNLPAVSAQPQQLEQVFLNIISNARYALNQKYPGADDNKTLEILGEKATLNNSRHIRIIFHDRGTGIKNEILDKIINPFFSTKSADKGTGLGLSISHGIISNHGGKLIIESIEGEFTRVIIELPAMKK